MLLMLLWANWTIWHIVSHVIVLIVSLLFGGWVAHRCGMSAWWGILGVLFFHLPALYLMALIDAVTRLSLRGHVAEQPNKTYPAPYPSDPWPHP